MSITQLPSPQEIRSTMEVIEIDDLRPPNRIGEIFSEEADKSPAEEGWGVNKWLIRAEKWDRELRRALYIEDYWQIDEELEEKVEGYALAGGMSDPSQKGRKLASNILEAQKNFSATSFSTVVNFPVDHTVFQDEYNLNQIAGPTGRDIVELPEYLSNDDWYFWTVKDDKKATMVLDDHTVYARHIRDCLQEKHGSNPYLDVFFEGYEAELIEYLPEF